jgi:hypothetical protein
MTGSFSTRALALLACVIAAAAVVAPAEAGSGASGQSGAPPGGVYTCDWISNHQVAALNAGVTCDYVTFITQMTGFNAGPQSAAASGLQPDCCGSCGFYTSAEAPTDGSRVGEGVYAWGPYEYSNEYKFTANYDPAQYYEWYVENTSGTIQSSGQGDYLHPTWIGPIDVPGSATGWRSARENAT